MKMMPNIKLQDKTSLNPFFHTQRTLALIAHVHLLASEFFMVIYVFKKTSWHIDFLNALQSI